MTPVSHVVEGERPQTTDDAPRLFAPGRIATIYLLLGLLWIALTDLFLAQAGGMSDRVFWIAAAKGSLFVVASSLAVWLLTRREYLQTTHANALLRAVVHGTDDAVFVKDRQGRYLLFNDAAAEVVGKAACEVIGRDDTALFSPADARQVMERDRAVMEAGLTETREEILDCGGRTRTFLATKAPYRDAEGAVVGLIGISVDITDRRRIEDQARQAQKLEVVGRLAGGLAHDFNNLLTIINGHGELLLAEMAADDRGRESVAAICDAGDRAARLTRQLLAFSRQSPIAPRPLDLSALVAESAKLLRRSIGDDVVLNVITDATPVPIMADPSQIEQVVLNLAVNARDAMPRGGTLTIETGVVEPSAVELATHPGLAPGRYGRLRVQDTGGGMTDAVKSRIFEPFFTTKEVGQGTGLGLSVVHGVVTQAGGSIGVDSAVGVGSTFDILFPLSELMPTTTEPESSAPRGTETVLLIEGDDSVRAVVQIALETHGYRVLATESGVDAERLAREHVGPIALIVTDVVMREMDGRKAADAVSAARPGVPVLFVSGHAGDALQKYGVTPADAFLQKPFSPLALARKVREILDATRRP